MSESFEALWARVLQAAEPEAVRRASATLAALAEGGFDVSLEVSVFVDDDDPWLPSVWITPLGPTHFAAARATDHVRQLVNVAYGDDGDVHLNDDAEPIRGFFERRIEPANARDVVSTLTAAWIRGVWERNVSAEAEVREVDLD